MVNNRTTPTNGTHPQNTPGTARTTSEDTSHRLDATGTVASAMPEAHEPETPLAWDELPFPQQLRLAWKGLTDEDKLQWVLDDDTIPLSDWFESPIIELLTGYYPIKKHLGRILTRFAERNRGRDLNLFAALKQQHDLEQAALHADASTTPQDAGTNFLIHTDTVERRPVAWLWEPYIARGKLCMLDGDPGVGKTMLAIQLAATLSRGFAFPDQHGKVSRTRYTPAPTLFIAMEDDIADTIKPRLEEAEADCRLIKVLNEAPDANGKPRPVTLDDMPYIERMIQEVQPMLVVIDSIQSVIGGKVDIHRANQVTEKLAGLEDLTRRYRCATVCIRHPSKPGQGIAKLIHRGMGSVAFIGRARLGMFVEEHPTDPTLALLVQGKSNAGAPACTQIFSKRDGRFSWAGVTRLSSRDLAGSGHGPDPAALLGAYLWLEHRLQDGRSYTATEIQEEMKEEGFKHGTVWEAKKRLGVQHARIGGSGTFTWRLPPLPARSTTETLKTSETSETSETSYSSKKSTTCEDSGASPEQLYKDVEVVEVSELYDVYTVVTEGSTPVSPPVNGSTKSPCYKCGRVERDPDTGLCVVCWPASEQRSR